MIAPLARRNWKLQSTEMRAACAVDVLGTTLVPNYLTAGTT